MHVFSDVKSLKTVNCWIRNMGKGKYWIYWLYTFCIHCIHFVCHFTQWVPNNQGSLNSSGESPEPQQSVLSSLNSVKVGDWRNLSPRWSAHVRYDVPDGHSRNSTSDIVCCRNFGWLVREIKLKMTKVVFVILFLQEGQQQYRA